MANQPGLVDGDDGIPDTSENGFQVGAVSFLFFVDDLIPQGGSRGMQQCPLVERFGDVIEGAEANGFGGGLDPRIAGNHDHRAAQPPVANLPQDIDSRAVGEDDVGKDHIEVGFGEPSQGLAAARRRGHRMAGRLEEAFKGEPDRFLVIDYQYSRTHI